MPISEEEWQDASIDSGIMDDAKDELVEAHPEALTVSEIIDRWDRTEYTNTKQRLSVILEVLVGLDEIEVGTVEGDASNYYRSLQYE